LVFKGFTFVLAKAQPVNQTSRLSDNMADPLQPSDLDQDSRERDHIGISYLSDLPLDQTPFPINEDVFEHNSLESSSQPQVPPAVNYGWQNPSRPQPRFVRSAPQLFSRQVSTYRSQYNHSEPIASWRQSNEPESPAMFTENRYQSMLSNNMDLPMADVRTLSLPAA